MQTIFRYLTPWLGAGLLLCGAGCSSSKVESELARKLEREQDIKTPADLAAEATQQIENAPGLSAEQKAQLQALRQEISGKMGELNRQSLELRAVLVDDVLAPGNREKEIKLIRKRLSKISRERVGLMTDGVDRANEILGRDELRRHFLTSPYMSPYFGYGFGYGPAAL